MCCWRPMRENCGSAFRRCRNSAGRWQGAWGRSSTKPKTRRLAVDDSGREAQAREAFKLKRPGTLGPGPHVLGVNQSPRQRAGSGALFVLTKSASGSNNDPVTGPAECPPSQHLVDSLTTFSRIRLLPFEYRPRLPRCQEKSYFTSHVSPARSSLARSPAPLFAMISWICRVASSS